MRSYQQAIAVLVRAVEARVGNGARVHCASLDGFDAAEAERLWDGHTLIDEARARAIVPVLAHVPRTTELSERFPLAVIVVDGIDPTAHARELSDVQVLADLSAETLLLAHDANESETRGVLNVPAFRRLTSRWLEICRARKLPLSMLAVALDGLAEINQTIGFEAGDNMLDEAVAFLARELPHATALAPLGGAVTVVLLAAVDREEAQQIAQRLAKSFERDLARVIPAPSSLSIGFATLDELPDDNVLHAARAALAAARAQPGAIVPWNASLADVEAADPMIDSIPHTEYQRILAIWRLFEALCHAPQLDDLIASTLRALLPLFRADRVALWGEVEGAWTPRMVCERNPDDARAAPALESVAEAARITDVLVCEDRGARVVMIALKCSEEITDVIEVSGTRPIENRDLEFLRTFALHMGRVIGQVQSLTEARRRQQEVSDRLRAQTIELRRLVRTSSGLVGNHASMQTVFRMIERSRTSNFPVVITGETGTGKEAVARLVHRTSNRRGPFVVVDCGAIPAGLLESELFGHEKGAFTGAHSRKLGHFEAAHQGTIFLDEIGELPLELQPKLLRVLQESTVRRLGGREMISVDFRLIAATHRDLEAMVALGTFRQDLYFRLRVLEIQLPALRERGDDIVLLALYSLRQYCAELGREMMTIAPDAEARLRSHPWPGNVRELQNVLRRAMLVVPGNEITAKDLHLDAQAPRRAPEEPGEGLTEADAATLLEDAVAGWFWDAWTQGATTAAPQDAIEAFLVRAAIQVSGGSISSAARLLDMHPQTFKRQLEELGEPALSRSIRDHVLAGLLDHELRTTPATHLRDRILRVLLVELLVFCQGNKSEMARHLGWGRQTLARQLVRLEVLPRTT
ncbi:MAG: sigma 54-interacting transcriptional regulator [Myxococcota bacterium]|nr:sigma 54-interacting transcriptional regulator [Myxococcota bacterium]